MSAKLIADIAMGVGGNSDALVLDGWAESEPTHRWSLGRESRLLLPVENADDDCVVVISATPCLHPPLLSSQIVMLAINGRLLAGLRISALRVATFRLPAGLESERELILGITHLSAGLARDPQQYRRAEPLGLAVHSVRVFRFGTVASPRSLPRVCEADISTGAGPEYDLPDLAAQFESLGQGCQFGLVQRNCGADPLGLLRFVDTTTAHLADGLIAGFEGVGDAGSLDLAPTGDARPRYRWTHRKYRLLYDTRVPTDEIGPEALQTRELRRLAFLQQKFMEDLRRCEKICVLTRGARLAEDEALAIFCALRLHGPNTLLWTVPGDPADAGRVDEILPGFLRGHLGPSDEHGYGGFEHWLGIMRKVVRIPRVQAG